MGDFDQFHILVNNSCFFATNCENVKSHVMGDFDQFHILVHVILLYYKREILNSVRCALIFC